MSWKRLRHRRNEASSTNLCLTIRFVLLLITVCHVLALLSFSNMSILYSGGVAQPVTAPNSNRRLLVRYPHFIISGCFVEKSLNVFIPTSGGAAQWIRALVGNLKIFDSRFGFRTGHCIVGSLRKILYACNSTTGPKHLSNVVAQYFVKFHVGVVDRCGTYEIKITKKINYLS